MQLTDHFTLEEMIFSDVAQRGDVDNSPSALVIGNLRKTAALMESVRAMLDAPIRVHSGYRCPVLNEMIGGSKTSVHPLGLACDFDCATFGTPLEIARTIEASRARLPEFDQCILEYGWVHLGLPKPNSVARFMFLTKKSAKDPYLDGIVA